MFDIEFERTLLKKFAKFDRSNQIRIQEFLEKKLSINPKYYSTKLIGSDNRFRARSGDYRIIFELNNEKNIITIFDIDHRSKIYK